jgi:hypothetical protein
LCPCGIPSLGCLQASPDGPSPPPPSCPAQWCPPLAPFPPNSRDPEQSPQVPPHPGRCPLKHAGPPLFLTTETESGASLFQPLPLSIPLPLAARSVATPPHPPAPTPRRRPMGCPPATTYPAPPMNPPFRPRLGWGPLVRRSARVTIPVALLQVLYTTSLCVPLLSLPPLPTDSP